MKPPARECAKLRNLKLIKNIETNFVAKDKRFSQQIDLKSSGNFSNDLGMALGKIIVNLSNCLPENKTKSISLIY